MNMIETMTEAIKELVKLDYGCNSDRCCCYGPEAFECKSGLEIDNIVSAVLKSIHEPDPHVVAIVVDKLNMDATKVAAVWMLMVEESLK